ncbi:Ankyrin repeat and MYND domain-containing protein 2 [Chionoecetes opilio]|uniref:Ankyrin repeat and MYND domain-containing protein 2 n=1 Tax=Chionoecetes opilio TaxID=41210 RepID=A0A8J8WMX5_CHIOP|nr:Ankyrin repeat and MYND domain-containing protein 2 [Chionoecetes opilio]
MGNCQDDRDRRCESHQETAVHPAWEGEHHQCPCQPVICVKFHYLAYVLKTLEKELKKADSETQNTDSSIFESIIRKWLRARLSDGFEEQLEYYVRDAIKAFPWVEMPLFIQLVRNMSGNNSGETSSLCILSGCINGQRAFQDDKACSTCGQETKKDLKKCSKCKMAQYCDKCCQKLHWSTHKKFCEKLAMEYRKREKKLEEERSIEEEEEKESKADVVADIEERIKESNDCDKDLASQAKNINVS